MPSRPEERVVGRRHRRTRVATTLFLALSFPRSIKRVLFHPKQHSASSSLNSKREETLCGTTNFSLSDASSSSSSSFTSSPRAHASLNTLLDSRAKKLTTLSLFDKAFFVFFFFFFSFGCWLVFFSLYDSKFCVREREESPNTLILLSLSLFCVCVYSTTHDFYTTTKKGRRGRDKKRDPPPQKKLPGAPNLGFYNFFLGFYFVCVFFGSWKGHSSAKIVLCIPLINYVEFITRT